MSRLFERLGSGQMALGVWIVYDISRKDYDKNVIRREELRQSGWPRTSRAPDSTSCARI